jgi:hypothetical protein
MPPAQCLLTVTSNQIDACAAFGMSCQGDPQSSPYGVCLTPTEGQACQVAVGCGDTTMCVTQGTDTRCRRACTTDADCPSLFQACVAGTGGSFCARTSCDATTYYKACPGGGTCVPVYGNDGTTTGECMASGSATGAGCSAKRGGPLCAEGSFCFTGTTGSTCAPLCDYTAATFGVPAAGPTCPSGQSCVFLGSSIPFGVCAPTCTAPTDCAAPLSCQTWNPFTSKSACLP